MITGMVFLLIVVTVHCRGGDIARMATIRPRHAWTVATAILIQVVIFSVLAADLPFAIASALHLASYGLALVFVWANRRIGGIRLTVLGGVLNLIAIVANGGVMPASAAALEFAGKPLTTGEFENSTTQADANLAFLGDVFALPEGLPFANVFSVGDIILLVGGYFLVSRACITTVSGVNETNADVGAGPEPDPATPSALATRSVDSPLPMSFEEAFASWQGRQPTPR